MDIGSLLKNLSAFELRDDDCVEYGFSFFFVSGVSVTSPLFLPTQLESPNSHEGKVMDNFLFKLLLLVIFLSFALVTAGSMTCEAQSVSTNLQSKVTYGNKPINNNGEDNLLEIKDIRFKILVWAVKQNITERYKKMDNKEFEGDYLQFIEYRWKNY